MGMHNPALGHRHGLSDLLSSLPALYDFLHLLRLLLQLEQLWLVLALGGSGMSTTITLLQKKKKHINVGRACQEFSSELYHTPVRTCLVDASLWCSKEVLWQGGEAGR